MTDTAPKATAYVAGISWPRSGHHLLVRLLQGYFGTGFGYCEFHRPAACCKVFPCARAGAIHLSKNHDFGQETPQIDGLPYLIQYRAFVPSVVSAYELSPERKTDDSAEAFYTYAAQRWGPYDLFRGKWIASDFAAGQVRLPYENLTADSCGVMEPVVALFRPDRPYDADRMQDIAASVAGISKYKGADAVAEDAGVKNRRRVEEFRWYDPDRFAALDALKLHRRQVIHRWRRRHGTDAPDPDAATTLALMQLPDVAAADRALA